MESKIDRISSSSIRITVSTDSEANKQAFFQRLARFLVLSSNVTVVEEGRK